MPMRIEDFGGATYVRDEAELTGALARRYGHGVNEFWLFHDDRKAPSLSIVVNGDLASLTYFPAGDHPGFTSVGSVDGLDPEGSSTFYINTPSERHEVANESLVPTSVAVQVAREFMANEGLPSSVEWSEL